jgi:hypothetical protein
MRPGPTNTVTHEPETTIVKSGAHSDSVTIFVERDERRQHHIDFLGSKKILGNRSWLGNSVTIA